MARVGPSPGLNNPRGSNAVSAVLLVRFANQLPTARSRSASPCANQLPATHIGMQRCSIATPPLRKTVGNAQAGMRPMSPLTRHITREILVCTIWATPGSERSLAIEDTTANTHRQRQTARRDSELCRRGPLREVCANRLPVAQVAKPDMETPTLRPAKAAVTKPACDQAGL